MYWGAVARLAALLAAIGLLTSRVGLLVHELVGHGGTAIALGGEIRAIRLFWFAGGWIRYDFAAPTRDIYLATSLGGIAIEAIAGLALWLALARRDGLVVRLARGVGAAFVVHAGWYFATGTWHGFGDGAVAHRVLGDGRYPAAIVVGLATCVMTFAAARLVLGALAAELPGGRVARVAGVLLAATLAAGLQIGLALGEVHVRGDSTYGAIMQPERERRIARELAAWQREQAARGVDVGAAERAARERALAAQHREPPFAVVLAFLLVAAAAVGAWRARPAVDHLTARHLAIAGALAVISVTAVIAAGALFA